MEGPIPLVQHRWQKRLASTIPQEGQEQDHVCPGLPGAPEEVLPFVQLKCFSSELSPRSSCGLQSHRSRLLLFPMTAFQISVDCANSQRLLCFRPETGDATSCSFRKACARQDSEWQAMETDSS